ncbi:MAG: GNAT family N-acetyltransferase, partial [Gammaproteobacteria bacterium]|nr:GNAT family N-acetyltransferase [Gammaproteobacteria bacterium]
MAHPISPEVTLLRGASADDALRDSQFIEAWQQLRDTTPHATAFQGPRFAATWYASYRDEWEPVLVEARDAAGALLALWPLAWRARTATLAHAGAHQAEYQGWLSQPATERAFIAAAWARLTAAFAFQVLQCKYLVTESRAATLREVLGCVDSRRHARPLMRLVAEDIRASFAKKSNKSRFNRLKRLGELEFRRIRAPAELDAMFTRMIEFYDLRQGAVNAVSPFHEDPRKTGFHRALFAAAQDELVVTGTFLGGELVAAYWGMVSGDASQLGILAHTPLLAEHSPGKLHIMQLSEYLLGEGLSVLDLTPGGDAWKERFANDHDEVTEATVYATDAARQRAQRIARLQTCAKQALGNAGVSPDQARAWLARVRRATP